MTSKKPAGRVRVALLGCGNVGASLASMLTDPNRLAEIEMHAGVSLELAGVAVASLTERRPSLLGVPAQLLTDDAKGLVERDDIDVVVELIGGIDPARDLIEAALRAGRPVVTANKALLATVGSELADLAASNGVELLYEASVASAIPLIRPLRESLAAERITRVTGIVNGTTNFILTRMAESGEDYHEALAEAQRLGLAERDPTYDVEGGDAAAKIAILASLAFRREVRASDVYVEGITAVRPIDIEFAAHLGYAVKLLAVAELVQGGPDLSVRVHPAMVPKSHPLAAVRGAYNAVFIEGEASGELMLYGRGAGGAAAASAVLGDLVVAARHLRSGGSSPAPSRRGPVSFRPLEELSSIFYLNVDVVDRPGVLAAVATVFGHHGVSIRSMEQVGLGDEARLVFLTHVAREGSMLATIEDLHHLDAVDRVGSVLRVIGSSDAPDPSAGPGLARP